MVIDAYIHILKLGSKQTIIQLDGITIFDVRINIGKGHQRSYTKMITNKPASFIQSLQFGPRV